MDADLLQSQTAETYKGALHLVMFGLAATFTGYNVGALLTRPEKRLAVNSVVYGGLTLLEAWQIRQHWKEA